MERDRRERRRKAEELFVAGANMGVVVCFERVSEGRKRSWRDDAQRIVIHFLQR